MSSKTEGIRRSNLGIRHSLLVMQCSLVAASAPLAAGCDSPVGPLNIELVILTPEEGDSALAGDTVVLSATVTVAGRLSDAAVTWATAEEGVLGIGNPVRVAFPDSCTRLIQAEVDLGDRGSQAASVAFRVLHNGPPRFTSVAIPLSMFDRDTVPLVAFANDDESEARIAWLVADQVIATVPSGDTAWWTPGNPPGDRTVVARALDAQGFASDSAGTVSVMDGSRIRWTAIGSRRGYGNILSDWGAITAVGPAGDIAVAFYDSPCLTCLWVFSADGAVRWQRALDGPLGDHSAGLTFATDGSLYAMAFFGWLYRFAPDGTQLWRRQGVGNDPHGRLAVDPDGRVLVGANVAGGAMVAQLDPATGTEQWRIERGTAYAAGPTVLADGSVAAQLGGILVRVTADGTSLADTLSASLAHYMSAADTRGLHYLAARSATVGLVAVNPDNTVRWTVPTTPNGPPAEPVIDADTTAYTATRSSSPAVVMAVQADGAVRWQVPVAGLSWIPRLAVLADGSLLVATGNYLHRLDRTTGTVLETVAFPADVQSGLAVAGDGTVYVVIADGRLLALSGWAPLDPDAPWPVWRRDNRRSASVPQP
jgi:hypothetical protein